MEPCGFAGGKSPLALPTRRILRPFLAEFLASLFRRQNFSPKIIVSMVISPLTLALQSRIMSAVILIQWPMIDGGVPQRRAHASLSGNESGYTRDDPANRTAAV